MKHYMGHFGETTTPVMMTEPKTLDAAAEAQSNTLFVTASSLANASLTNTFDRAEKLAKSQEIQEFIKDNGLEPYLKDVNKEGIKNILAVVGIVYLGKLAKSKVGLVSIGLLGAYFLYTRKDKLLSSVAEKASGVSAVKAV